MPDIKQRIQRKKEQFDFVFHFMDILGAPVITFSDAWKDCIPKRLLEVIRLERLIQGIQHKQEASDAELVAYIMTRTFESPMTREWTDIYTHFSCKVCQQHWNEDHWDEVQAPRELTEYELNYLVKPLRQWIYKKRREAVKSRMRDSAEGITIAKTETEYEPLKPKANENQSKQTDNSQGTNQDDSSSYARSLFGDTDQSVQRSKLRESA